MLSFQKTPILETRFGYSAIFSSLRFFLCKTQLISDITSKVRRYRAGPQEFKTKNNLSEKSHIAKKCRRGPFGLFENPICCNISKNRKWDPLVSSDSAKARTRCWLLQRLEPATAGLPLGRLTSAPEKWSMQGELCGLRKKRTTVRVVLFLSKTPIKKIGTAQVGTFRHIPNRNIFQRTPTTHPIRTRNGHNHILGSSMTLTEPSLRFSCELYSQRLLNRKRRENSPPLSV